MRIARWAAVCLALFVVAGCSDPLAQQVGSTAQPRDLPAVVVTAQDDGSVIEVAFGQSVILGDLGVPMEEVYIESDDTAIVYPVQPSEGQGAAGLVAVGEGVSRVTVWESFPTTEGQLPLVTIQVRVVQRPDSP